MFKISGLDELSRQLSDANKAIESLDGELGTLSFDPDDPASIEAAIQSMEAIIEDRLGQFASNPIIAPLSENMKEKYRESIIDHAAAARIQSEGE
ncbi:MAG: hypothetical protein Q7K57_25805 [Burkholderiaceae bacterium]|nr:hypothetical protein [Burkholderiaceae bacterium]